MTLYGNDDNKISLMPSGTTFQFVAHSHDSEVQNIEILVGVFENVITDPEERERALKYINARYKLAVEPW